jgi:hypothetical protein
MPATTAPTEVWEPGGSPGNPLSIADLLTQASAQAVRDSLAECVRAQGRRGMVYLDVEVCLGDGGELLWMDSAVYFSQKRHRKDR